MSAWKGHEQCPICLGYHGAHSPSCNSMAMLESRDRQISNLEKRCQELAAHAVLDEEQIANLQASRDRWKEYAMSLKRQQYQELITEDMIAEECKAIAALKAAGEWED